MNLYNPYTCSLKDRQNSHNKTICIHCWIKRVTYVYRRPISKLLVFSVLYACALLSQILSMSCILSSKVDISPKAIAVFSDEMYCLSTVLCSKSVFTILFVQISLKWYSLVHYWKWHVNRPALNFIWQKMHLEQSRYNHVC